MAKPQVEIVSFSGDEATKANWEKRLAQVATFMGADKVVYEDGKNEEYTFFKPDGTSLHIRCGHDVHPGAGWLVFSASDETGKKIEP